MLPLLLTMLACSGLSGNGGFDLGTESAADEIPPGTLRVDISPSAGEDNLLPQSFVLAPGTYEDVTVSHTLSPTSELHGTLTAAMVQGWTNVAASAEGPLNAVVRATRGTLLQGGVAATDEAGFVSLFLPGDQAYAVEILPVEATASPMVYLGDQQVFNPDGASGGLDITQTLDAGMPVYGRVTDEAGARLVRAPLHIRRADVDIQSAGFTTDNNGWFVARVQPGYSYVLETEGTNLPSDGPIPTVSAEFFVEEGSTTGAEVNLNVGDRSSVSVEARVTTTSGERINHPQIRATSQSLRTGSLVVETDGTQEGLVSIDLLPGTWTIEVWPGDDNAELTPWRVTDVVISDDLDLGSLVLAAPTTLSGTITSSSGDPAEGVTVTAVEAGFGEYTYSAVTSADGSYSLAVPRTEYRLQAIPSVPESGAYTNEQLDLADAGASTPFDLQLARGTPVSGVATVNDAPVPFALIAVYDHAKGVLLARTLTDGEGAYTVRIDLTETEADDTGDSADTGGDDTGSSDTGPV